MTSDDFPNKMFWLMYQKRDTLPSGIDIFSEDEWMALPEDVRNAVTNDLTDEVREGNAVAAGAPSHYNWSMFCLLEFLHEEGVN